MTRRRIVNLAIFDLDSTLSDTLLTVAITRRWLLSQMCREFPAKCEEIVQVFSRLLRQEIHEIELVGQLQEICLQGEATTASNRLAEIDRDFRSQVVAHSKLLPGALEALLEIKRRGGRAVIWTNKRAKFVGPHVDALGLAGILDAVYCRADNDDLQTDRDWNGKWLRAVAAAERKPSSMTLIRILEDFGISNEAAILVGNNRKNDGSSAAGAGVSFVLADFGVPSSEVEAHLFELTEDPRISYRSIRHAANSEGAGSSPPVAVLKRDLFQLFDHFEFLNP